MEETLPIDAVLPELVAALRGAGRAVLQAPPGAGKTTRVPPALLAAGVPGRIVMLAPRRLAARAAAERMAAAFGEAAGGRVGYRMRGDARVSDATRIEVVTEGILTRMIQTDPALDGVGAVVFDEFHERSLTADLGLALAWEVRGALRPDLSLLVMSATLDSSAAAAMLDDAPVVTSAGRSFPVRVDWLDRPMPRGPARMAAMADALAASVPGAGTLLCFLPGESEIRRMAGLLTARLPADVAVQPLYGAMPFAAQRAVTTPAGVGRRVVLATAIAETSLTIPGVTVVVDGGLARRARFDPGAGMTRLVTERVTRAEADQRAGRAGRVAPGVCLRLWTRGEDGALAAFPPPAIMAADLAGLVLDCALWGARAPGDLRFPTPPPDAAWAEARTLLASLGALDAGGAITRHGRRMAAAPLHPRLAHMLLTAGPGAADLAALLTDRDILRGAPVDLSLRLEALRDPRRFAAERGLHVTPGAVARIAAEARRLRRLAGPDEGRISGRGGGGPVAGCDGGGRVGDGPVAGRKGAVPVAGRDGIDFGAGREGGRSGAAPTVGASTSGRGADRASDATRAVARQAALAYPDRIGLRRAGTAPRWLLSGGKGAAMDPDDPLAGARLIVVTDTDGDPREARIRQAVEIAESDLRAVHGDRIVRGDHCAWSPREGRVLARRQDRLGAIALEDRRWDDAPPDAVVAAMLDGVRDLGLVWTDDARRLRARAMLARAQGASLPDMTDTALMSGLEGWLAPFLQGIATAEAWRRFDIAPALRAMLDRTAMAAVDRAAPSHVATPLGRRIAVDYDGDMPQVAVRLQEMFGVTVHPVVAGQPLRVVLLSPASRPVQVTTDLPGFWADSYADVRREMRGRYPRHPWPEDGAAATPPAPPPRPRR